MTLALPSLVLAAVLSAVGTEPQWISDTDDPKWAGDVAAQPPLPKNTIWMRRTFRTEPKEIVRASAEICGYGFCDVWINGQAADPARRLAPPVTDYRFRNLSVVYDLSAFVRPGEDNTLGLWLSPGYSDDFSKYGWRWLLPKRAFGKLRIDYADGTVQTVVTDAGWEWTDRTPIVETSVYHGETYDARLEDSAWCLPTGSSASWRKVVVVPPVVSSLAAAGVPHPIVPEPTRAPAVRACETFRPVAIRRTGPDTWMVDFGQNLAGFCELHAKGARGTAIVLSHGEELTSDGLRLDLFPQRHAKAADTFILAGTGGWETFVPRFTYHGFRYVEVKGYPGELGADAIRSRAVRADVRDTADFACSDDTLNWLFSAAKWTLRSNLLNYPSDCCDRDERTPCRGDSMRSEPTAIRYFDLLAFYDGKWLDDIQYDHAIADTTGDRIMLPYRLWRHYGARDVIERRYGNMVECVEWLLKSFPDYIVTGGYGDWCHPNDKTWNDYYCEPKAVCSGYLCKYLQVVRDTAAELGREEDRRRFDRILGEAKRAYDAAFYNPETGAYGGDLQVNYLIPLSYDLVPPERRPAVVKKLVETIRRDGNRLTTGGIGTRHLVEVLCREGYGDLAYELLTQPEYPGYGYMKGRGATTLWEQWYYEKAMNSHAHMMFTGPGSTLFTCFAGIRLLKAGYAETEIRPVFPRKLDWVDAVRDTPQGRLSVRWRREAGGIAVRVSVPPTMKSVFVGPTGERRTLESGTENVFRVSDGTEPCSLVDSVNPLIGAVTYPDRAINNVHGFGKTFPGAASPFGTVQLSPDTITGGDNGPGYSYSHGTIEGFSFTHLSGIGWYGEFGNLQVMPSERISAFSHDRELARAGYYSVVLDDCRVKAELTAAEDAGVIRFTYPASAASELKIDLARRIGERWRAKRFSSQDIRFESDRSFTGTIRCDHRDGGWGRGDGLVDYTLHFRAYCSKPLANRTVTGGNTNLVLHAKFPTVADEKVELEVRVSFESIPPPFAPRGFDAVRAASRTAWEKAFACLDVEGGTARQRTIFATALYHAFLDPRAVGRGDGWTRRTVFSGWDVFRSEFPLLTLLRPDVVSDTINSLSDVMRRGDRDTLPVWDIFGCKSSCMIGDPLIPVIADAYEKGIRTFDAELVWRQCVETSAKRGNAACGWTPGSLSQTLEYCYDDWCMGRFAEMLGKTDEAARYYGRAKWYTNCWDRSVGWMRSRQADGTWLEPWGGREKHGQGCVESNPWQQGWFVPHDVEGLAALMGGMAAFTRELETFFARVPPDFGWNDAYNHPNEPCHTLPFLFAFSDKPELASRWTRRICDRAYGDGPYGLCGNEDVGQMSAWYVLAAIGLSPVCPGDGRWMVTEPIFDRVTVRLDPRYYPGGRFEIRKRPGLSCSQLNGRALDRPWVTTAEVSAGGRLWYDTRN